MENIIKPIEPIINPFETEKERQDSVLMHVIDTAISVCGYSGDDAAAYSMETLRRLGRYDLLPPCERGGK